MATTKMNPKVKRKWVKALRSGKYKQGTGMLKVTRDNDEPLYCCLGVLCEVAVGEGIVKSYPGSNGLPPDAVEVWAGLDGDPLLGTRKIDGREPYATYLNDDGKSFRYIADRIEKYL